MNLLFAFILIVLSDQVQCLNKTEFTIPYRCLLPHKESSFSLICRDHTPMYFYDAATKLCARFIDPGCGGNENRFETSTECERICGAAHSVHFHARCFDPLDVGKCRYGKGNIMTQFYYDSLVGQCKDFTYSGCGGNRNRFRSQLQCAATCRN